MKKEGVGLACRRNCNSTALPPDQCLTVRALAYLVLVYEAGQVRQNIQNMNIAKIAACDYLRILISSVLGKQSSLSGF